MSLYQFFFPEQAQFEELRELSEKGRYSDLRPPLDPLATSVDQNQNLVEWENNDIGILALVCESLIRMGERKGHFTRQEVLAVMNEVDIEDGTKDGKFKPSLVTKPDVSSGN